MGPVDLVIAWRKAYAVGARHQEVLYAEPIERNMTNLFYQCYVLQILPLDVHNWTSILLLAPEMVVSNRPNDHHAEY